MIALPSFVVFCQTSTRISHRYTHVPSLLNLPPKKKRKRKEMNLPPVSLPSHSSRWSRSPCLSSLSQIPVGYLFTYGNGSFPVTLSRPLPPPPSPCVHRSVLYVCFSIAVLKMNSSGPSLQIPYVCASIRYLYFPFWLTSLYIMSSSFIHLIRTDSNAFLFMAE